MERALAAETCAVLGSARALLEELAEEGVDAFPLLCEPGPTRTYAGPQAERSEARSEAQPSGVVQWPPRSQRLRAGGLETSPSV